MALRYWVGNAGSWTANNTSNWAATSGGAGGQSVPGPLDDVYINASSLGAGESVTITYNPTVNSVNLTQSFLSLNNLTLTCNTFNMNGTAIRGITFGTTSGSLDPSRGNLIIQGGNLGVSVFTMGNDTNVINTGATRNVFFTYSGSVGTRVISAGIGAGLPSNIVNTFIDIIVNAGSDNVSLTNTGLTGITAGNIDFTGFSGNAVNSVYGNLSGNLILNNTMTLPGSGGSGNVLNFIPPTGRTSVITTAGKIFDIPVTANGQSANAVIRFADNFAMSNNRQFIQAGGNLDFNDKIIEIPFFSSSATANRRLIFGTNSTVNITGGNTGNTTVWNTGVVTNLSVTGNAVVNITGNLSSGNRALSVGTPTEANSISFNLSAGTDNINLSGNVMNLNTTGFTGNLLSINNKTLYGNLVVGTGTKIPFSTASNIIFAGTTGNRTINVNNQATPVNMVVNAGANIRYTLLGNLNISTGGNINNQLNVFQGTLDLNDFKIDTPTFGLGAGPSNIRGLAFGNTGVLNVTAAQGTIWQSPQVANFSYTGTPNVNFTSTTGTSSTKTISHGSTSGGSFATKAPPMKIPAGNLTLSAQGHFTELDFTGFTGALNNSTRTMYGNLILSPGMTVTGGTLITTFASPNAVQTFNTNGVATTQMPITVAAPGGTFLVTSNMNLSTAVILFNDGTFDTQGFNITTGGFNSNTANTRIFNGGNSTFNITGSGNSWVMANANLTVNAANTSIAFGMGGGSNALFVGGNSTYRNFTVSGPGTGNIIISGNNTFTGTFTANRTSTYSVLFTAGTTTTVGGFSIPGTAGNTVTIDSDGVGTHNLVYIGAGTVTVARCSIADSNASPADTWYAPLTSNNIDGGNNTGWIFGAGPVVITNGNFFLLFQD